MRTTLTLDPDVDRQLRELCEQRHQPFKQIVNEALRLGLGQLMTQRTSPRRTFRIQPVSLGRPHLQNLDDVASVLEIADSLGEPARLTLGAPSRDSRR